MSKKAEWDKLDKAVMSFLNTSAVPHKRPKKPTKEELNKRFKLVIDSKGKPTIKEVND